MKKALFLFALFSALTPLLPSSYAEGKQGVEAAAPADAEDVVRVTFSRDDNDADAFIVQFSEPMVLAERVGKLVDGSEYLTCDPAKKMQGMWVSSSAFKLHITDTIEPLDILHLSLKTESLRSLQGHPVEKMSVVEPEHRYSFMVYAPDDVRPGEPILFTAREKIYESAVAEAAKNAYYLIEDKKSGETISKVPAAIRPATVKDALRNWEMYEAVTLYRVTEQDRKALQEQSDDALLPSVLCAEPYVGLTAGRRIRLMLPGIGDFDKESCSYRDAAVTHLSSPSFDYMLSNERVGVGEYRVQLAFTRPIPAADVPELMENLPWTFLSVRPGEEDAPMEHREGGVWFGESDYSTVELTPLTEETLAGKRPVMTDEQKTTEGVSELYFRAKVTGDRVRLRLNCPFTSVFGDTLTESELRWYGNQDRDYTVLAPRKPKLLGDLLNNSMERGGEGILRYSYRSLRGLRIHVHRVEANSPQAALLLGKYLEKYTPATDSYRYTYYGRHEAEQHALPEELWTLVPHQEKIVEFSEEEATHELNLKELFGEETQGMFFVEASGETHPEWQQDGYMLNQGLVQLTNLGLMWKRSGTSTFVWAYHLSDAQPVPTAELRLLDEQGRTVATAAVKDGVAQLPKAEGVAYLQLVEGSDCYTTTATARDCDISHGSAYWDDGAEELLSSERPRPVFHIFSDRGLYRPGETAHIKGMVRWLQDNKLSLPDLESVELKVTLDDEEQVIPVTPEADGSFSADLPLKAFGRYSVQAVCTMKGDKDKTSPDMAFLVRHGVQEGDGDEAGWVPYQHWNDVAESRTSYSLWLEVTDFRRNAFEVETELELDDESNAVRLTADAVNFTGAPVAEGKVRCSLDSSTHNFCPEGYSAYYFGDYRDRSAQDYYYDVYYCGNRGGHLRDNDYRTEEILTDEKGHAVCSFSLPEDEFPGVVELDGYTSVTDGNELTISDHARMEVYQSNAYVGISRRKTICEAGTVLKLNTIVVNAEGEPIEGEPLNATLTVTRKVVHNYRYGAESRTNVQSCTELETEETRAITVSGTPQEIRVETTDPGEYLVDVEGEDADGNRFHTAVTYYVYGGDVSPWEVGYGTGLRVLANDVTYNPGDTAQVLVMTPVDGEVLITVERGGVLRYFRRSVSVANPVVDIPLTEEDAPMVYVSAFLVQTGEANRAENGMPVQKLGTTALHIEPVKNKLAVELETPQTAQRPGQECTVGGIVRDAEGKPVAGASVTLYAEDEGVLQVIGYDEPDPMSRFFSHREHGVRSYSSLNQLLGEDLAERDYGNKGVFVGGGDDFGPDEEAPAGYLREDFTPCALWLPSLRTDENGHFSATFRNPDTLTRYRLMAVCAAGADKFGSAQASYEVDTPVRVEPSAPLTATVGDELQLPATVSMDPAELPESLRDKEQTWNVTLSGTSNALCPPSPAAVTLKGDVPRTVMQPVKLTAAGDCRLTWRVQGTGELAQECDAVAHSFTVRPPMPFLREAVCDLIKPGESTTPAAWFRGAFAPATTSELTFSTSPLTGAADGVRYLITYPHGCVEQLSSTLLPWLFREELEQAVGLRFPEGKETSAVVEETKARIMNRLLPSGFFSYWAEGNANRNFTPYVALVLSEAGVSDRALRSTTNALREELKEQADANLVGLYYLAKVGNLDGETFVKAFSKREKANESELWLLAVTAELMEAPELAAQLVTLARKAKGKGSFCYGLPSAMAAETLWAVTAAPEDPATARQLRLYVESVARNSPTTWESGWMCLIIHEYLNRAELADATATLNGQELSMSKPLHLNVRADDKTEYRAEGATVYVSGTVEGYQAEAQPEKMVDKGFAVSRRYEKLNDNGTWSPTETFRVGDVVRVTLSVEHTAAQPAVYMALEDRLPAAFEAVNPELTTQALPDCVRTDTYSWGGSGFINHREYAKDCVRFYVTRWGNGAMTARYVARVVKSGSVTAPAAKAELMYRPQVYGLSIPQHFTILPR